MRDRLIELVNEAKEQYFNDVTDRTETDYIVECLLDNGVIVPPVSVGQTVWVVFRGMLPTITECEVVSVTSSFANLDDRRRVFDFRVVGKGSRTLKVFIDNDINRRVFLSLSSAEKALRKGGEQG